MPTLLGTESDDNLLNDGSYDAVSGLGGNDTLEGASGNDSIDGGAGDDFLIGGAGDDFLFGGTGTDTYIGGEGHDAVWFEDATQGVSANLVTGVIQNDGFGNAETISEVEGINGSQFGDDFNAGGGYAIGRAGNDNLTANWVNGGSGNDTLVGGGSVANLDYGDDGFDSTGVSAQGVVVNLTTGIATDNWGNTDQLSGFANVSGSFYADQITGDTSANDLFGGSGNDTLDGGEGDDNLNGWEGDDSIVGGAGDDFLIGGMGTDTYVGGEGHDAVWFEDATQGVSANLVTGVIQNDGFGNAETISEVEGINGSQFGDDLNAGGGYVIGSAGNDNLTANWVNGGSGNDTLVGGGSDANLDYGDNGFDPAGVTAQGVVVNLTTGIATDNWSNTDQLSGFANVSGSFYADRIIGNTSANDLFGGGGNDTLNGGAGNDYLSGWEGNDSMLGGAGSDTLEGGSGNDTMNGGTITDLVNLSDLNLVTYAFASGGIDLNLQTGTAQDGDGGTDTLVNINFVEGSEFDDSITGTIGKLFEQFEGRAGNDTIDGGVITSTNNGTNRVTYLQAPGGINANLATGVVQDGYGDNDTLFNIQSIRGSNHGDNMVGSDTTAWTENFEGRAGNDTIDGAGGFDLVRYDAATTGVNVNFATGVVQDGQGGIDTLSNVEGVRGSSHGDTLSGGNVDNDAFEFFQGGAGNDTIDGGSGYDRADYTTAQAAATVTLGGAANGTALDGQGGTDTLTNVEAVRGSSFNDRLTGSDSGAFESFEGMAGNDTIDGMGGTDRADYVGSAAAVQASLLTGVARDGFGGTDRLLNIENLAGSTFGDVLSGGIGVNRIDGRGGNDTINGAGGIDSLDGAEGSDLYLVAAAGQHSAAEFFDSGAGASDVDEVRFIAVTASTLKLFAGDTGIERVVIGTGTGVNAVGTGTIALNVNAAEVGNALEIVGNAGANRLTGTVHEDTLKGGDGADRLDGGQGVDAMEGGSGNDTYVVDDVGDVAVEAGTLAGGIDTIESSIISVVLNDVGANLENLTLIGSGDIDGTGNDVANTIKGNSGANELMGGLGNDNLSGAGGNDTLDGGTGSDTLDGGIGKDTLLGGAGDDTYVVNVVTDRVYETTTAISTTDAGGIDMVLSGVNWILGSFVENLTLTGGSNTTGTGNVLGNQITGNSGNNVINGARGNDSLDGGAGDDIFRFASTLNASTNRDSIGDFVSGQDKLQLENAIFTGLTALGTLNAANFVSGAGIVAADANDFILYDTNTGVLAYDRDGNGASLAVAFAELVGQPALTAVDFIVT